MIQTVYKNRWLEVRKMVNRYQGVKGYYFVHEIRCRGTIIAMMPWKRGVDGNIRYMLRHEITPCWGMGPKVSSITGGLDRGDTILDCAKKELWEEAGFRTDNDKRFQHLGSCHGTKSSDTVYQLFAVNVNWLPEEDAPGDGSELEDKAKCLWVTDRQITMAVDPLVFILHYRTSRLIRRMKKRIREEEKKEGIKKALLEQMKKYDAHIAKGGLMPPINHATLELKNPEAMFAKL